MESRERYRAHGENSIQAAEYRIKCAEKASTLVIDQILVTNDPVELPELFFRYCCYDYEQSIHSIVWYQLRLTSGDDELEEDIESTKASQPKLEAVISSAKTGDYTLMKDLIFYDSVDIVESIREANQETAADVTKLQQQIRLIPDSGNALLVPQPAWLDSRYNGDLGSEEKL